MARTRRIKKDGDAHYHVMSRTNGKLFLLKDSELKREIIDAMQVAAAFSGVNLDAHTLLDNHFHIVCSVVKPDAPLSESEIIKRVAILRGNKGAAALAKRWERLRKNGGEAAVEQELEGWRRRMHDVSEFTKTFKELVNIIYKRHNEHCGSIWSGRFTSTLIEGGRYLATCIRYVELNSVRAGIVKHARDYAFSSHNSEAAAFYASYGETHSSGSVPAGMEQGGKTNSSGSVPVEMGQGVERDATVEEWERRLLRRVVQIGSGVVFGSRAFVAAAIGAFEACFHGDGVCPHGVFGAACASHGHRLAAKEAA